MGERDSAVYVYGVARSDLVLPENLVGVRGAQVRICEIGAIAAVVSNIDVDVIRAERKNLSAHQAVQTAIAKDADVLPVAFGMISDSEDALCALLADNEDVLVGELDRVAGRVEMTVRLRWQQEDTFRIFVERFPELRKRRDACFGGQREPGQMELLELGRLFEALLKREREDKTSLALGILGQAAAELKNVEPNSERILFDMNCLVGRDQESKFDSAVEELAGNLGDEFVLEVRGPVPPYSFVSVTI